MLFTMLLRGGLRHPLRSVLTVAGVAVAILAFGLLRTVVDAWYAGVDASAADRLVTRNAISLIFPMPIAYRERIRSVDGVRRVAAGVWFGAYYQERKNFFANFAVEPEPFLAMYPEFVIPEEQRMDFLADRKAAVVGAGLAEQWGWEVGDTVVLTGTVYPGQWDFTIRAIYKGRDPRVDEFQFFFHWEYLNEALEQRFPSQANQVGVFWVQVKDPDRAPRVASAVDAQFANSVAETLTETEKAFQQGFVAMSETILLAIQGVSFIIVAIILVVVANTMAMSVRERTREYAVLKTLGFGAGSIMALVLGESVSLTLAGGALGIGLIFPASAAFAEAVGQYFPIFVVGTDTLAY